MIYHFRHRLNHLDAIEKRVKERTKELHIANDKLKREIGERMRTEKALRESQHECAVMISDAPDPIVRIDLDGTIRMVNPAAEKLSGFNAEELTGRHFGTAGIFTANSLVKASKELVHIIAGKNRQPLDYEIKCKDGSRRFIEGHAKLIKIANKAAGVQVIFRDITERRKIEREMRIASEKYKTIFENSAVAITVTDANERIVSWNHAAEVLLGMGKEDLFELPIKSIYPEESWKKIRSYNLRNKGKELHLQTQILKKSGVTYDVDLSLSIVREPDGTLIGAIGIMRDITEKMIALRALELAEQRYRTIFENSAAAITVIDEKERIISWNQFAEKMLGMTREDLYLRPVESLYPPEEWQKIRAHNVREKGMIHNLETRIQCKSGELIDAAISISVLKDPDGGMTGAIGIVQDISERKLYERLKDEFVSIVSHELRTPLFVIREGISQVFEELLGQVNQEQKKFLSISLRNIDRLTSIINDLLDISKIEAGRMEIERQKMNLIELVHGVHESFAMKARSKGLSLEEHFSDDAIEIDADWGKLTQVFTNLVGNALKFTHQGSISITVIDRDDQVECHIKDSGCGIASKHLSKVFDKFHQFGRGNSPGEKGSGLGLSISKGIVELHDGKIWIESKEGKGTDIAFQIPKRAA